jgi:DNA-nicking Smr family endonuclease
MARRRTSDEEQQLFEKTLSDARRLRGRARVAFVPRVKSPSQLPPLKPPVFLDRAADPIGGHRAADLRRGRTEPEVKLDLHGMSHDRAYRVLIGFLKQTHSDDKRVVLIITGKGGVLRSALPLWLGQAELEPLVSGIAEAHIKHGGSGAFYVSLRRKHRPR